MRKIKTKNQLYHLKYDGDILVYKSRLISRPFFCLIGWERKCELPLNILLHYRKRSFLLFKVFQLYINQYHPGQKKPHPIKLRRFLLLKSKKSLELQSAMDRIITNNSSGVVSIALAHIHQTEISRYYDYLFGSKLAATQLGRVRTVRRIASSPAVQQVA